MAGGSRRGGDFVLGGRHLVGIFALLVVVLGIVFTLGYLLGRSRYEEQLRAAVAGGAGKTAGASTSGAGAAPGATAGRSDSPPPADWDFYRSAEPPKPPERLAAVPQPVTAPVPPVESPAAAGKPAAGRAAPAASALIPKGSITLQVAALLREADALALARALQEKKFPAIVTTPTADRYYRVQVGPYPDANSANSARRELEKQGFKSIVRR
jgi:cell division septation protein DedD